MTTTNIQKEITHILMDMGIPEKAITDKASFYKDLGLDSLDFSELIMELEHRFSTEIPILEAREIQTVSQAATFLRQRLT